MEQEDVNHLGKFIKYCLRYRRKTVERAYKELVKEDSAQDPKSVGLAAVDLNLRRYPISLNSKDQSRLVARYLIEDNFDDYVWYDTKARNNKIVVKSIWKNLIREDPIPPIEKEKATHKEVLDLIVAHSKNIKLEIQKAGSHSKFDEQRVLTCLKNSGIELTPDQFQYTIVQLAGRSYSLE